MSSKHNVFSLLEIYNQLYGNMGAWPDAVSVNLQHILESEENLVNALNNDKKKLLIQILHLMASVSLYRDNYLPDNPL